MKINVKNKKGENVVISLSQDEVKEIKSSELFERTKANLKAKAQIKLMRSVYFKKTFWSELLILCIAAFAVTVAFDYFISATGKYGIFPSGLGTVSRFFAILTFPDDKQNQTSFYFIYYLVMNIPLMIFGYKKLGVKFTLMTLLYMLLSIGFDQVLTRIPVINPNDWYFIVNARIDAMPTGYEEQQIWLFVFAVFGGAIMGWGYALTYKVGASTAGTDFITVYFSKKKNKEIGTINRNVNFVIVFIIISLNAALSKTGTTIEKIEFIFGPSLFATFVFLVIQAITINAVYPKNVKRTITITTSKPDEVQMFLFDSGYRNDVIVEKVKTSHYKKEDLDKIKLTITITVMSWKILEKGIINIDSEMNINILKTKKVIGPFINGLKDERREEFIKNKLESNTKIMNKIEKEAIYKTWKKINKVKQKSLFKRNY